MCLSQNHFIGVEFVQDRRRSPIEVRLAAERRDEEGVYVIMWWMRVSRSLP